MANQPGTSKILVSAALVGLLGLSACAGRIDVRGNYPDPERLALVEPGKTTRDDTLDLLGSPSSVASFDENEWYYIGEKTREFAVFETELLERTVLKLRFAENGVLETLETLTAEDGRQVETVDRKTPTVGKEIGVMEQLLGNFGRFNP